MTTALPERDEVLNAIRTAAKSLGHSPSRAEFKASSGMTEYQVLKHFPSWREAFGRPAWSHTRQTCLSFQRSCSKTGASSCGASDGFRPATSIGVMEPTAPVSLRKSLGLGRRYPRSFGSSPEASPSGLTSSLFCLSSAPGHRSLPPQFFQTKPVRPLLLQPTIATVGSITGRPTAIRLIFGGFAMSLSTSRASSFFSAWLLASWVTTSKRSRPDIQIARPSDRSMLASGNVCGSSSSLRAATSGIMGTHQMAATSLCAGVTTGRIVQRRWKSLNSAQSFGRFRHLKNEQAAKTIPGSIA